MVVAFTGQDNHARSLRNSNQTSSDYKKNIIAIFSKEKNKNGLYENLGSLSHQKVKKHIGITPYKI